MKKKILASLFAVLMVLPMMVSAAEAPFVIKVEQDKVVDEDNMTTETIKLYFDVTSSEGFTVDVLTDIVFDITKGDDVSYGTVSGSDNFSAVRMGDELTISLINSLEGSETFEEGESVHFATLTVTYLDGTDCTLQLDGSLITTTTIITPNVQTGINIPLVALGAVGVLSAGIYLVVSKKNKIYNV